MNSSERPLFVSRKEHDNGTRADFRTITIAIKRKNIFQAIDPNWNLLLRSNVRREKVDPNKLWHGLPLPYDLPRTLIFSYDHRSSFSTPSSDANDALSINHPLPP